MPHPNGVYEYDGTEAGLMKDRLNLLGESVDTEIGEDRTRLDELEARYPIFRSVVASDINPINATSIADVTGCSVSIPAATYDRIAVVTFGATVQINTTTNVTLTLANGSNTVLATINPQGQGSGSPRWSSVRTVHIPIASSGSATTLKMRYHAANAGVSVLMSPSLAVQVYEKHASDT